jgi:hypothetical protein
MCALDITQLGELVERANMKLTSAISRTFYKSHVRIRCGSVAAWDMVSLSVKVTDCLVLTNLIETTVTTTGLLFNLQA